MAAAPVGFHCPECARRGRQTVYTRATWSTLRRRPMATLVLIALNVVVYLAGFADTASNAVAGTGGLVSDGGLYGPAVAAGDWWRVVTSGFLHAGLMHLLFNMLALYYLGAALEPALGSVRYVAVYATSLLTGALGVLVLDPNALTVGASGAVFGLLGTLLVVQRAQGIDPWSSGLGGVLLVNLLITFGVDGISIGGHLGGLAGGLVSGWLLVEVGPKAFGQRWTSAGLVAAVGAASFAGCLVAASAAV
jgi:membrane associated rhomboid family serine protease